MLGAYEGAARRIASFAPHPARETIAGASAAASIRSGRRVGGLHTRYARTCPTRPIARTSSRSEGPTHQGLPIRHAAPMRPSRERRSGPSSSSGAAGRHVVHARSRSERVRKRTAPGPRQCTPTSENRRPGSTGVGAAPGRGATSITAVGVGPAAEAAGTKIPAASSTERRTSKRRIRSQGCSHALRAQAGEPCVDAILTP